MPEHSLQQKQTQSLILAPQLRQSLKILQAPAMELRNAILEELEMNPSLEELPYDGPSVEELSAGDDAPGDEAEADFDEGDFDVFRRLGEDWQDHFAQEQPVAQHTREDAERRQHFFDSVVAETSLQRHLMEQAEMSDLNESEMRAMTYLIGSLDPNGFLDTPPADIALMANLPLGVVNRALEVLRSFDPVGIGSADLQSCLLFQLAQRGRGDSVAARILRDDYPLLLRRRVVELARKHGLHPDEIQRAIREIGSLDPAPARPFGEDRNRVVVPDVRIHRDSDTGEWLVDLNQDYIPRLRISNTIKEFLAQGKLKGKDREYIREKIRSGKFLISSIELRQQTLERIARILLRFQAEFFEHGVSRLKPLIMNRVAEEMGVHETTISRAIANKYIDTPFGVFEFKYFFTAGFVTEAGVEVSNRSVKDAIQQIVESENPAKPRSDQEIVRILAEKGFKIARRTVAKYREELGILATNLRRQYG